MNIDIIVLFIFLIFSAFFSAAEVAFLGLSDAKVKSMVLKKLPRSKKIAKLTKNRRRLLVTILIGNNIVNIAASSLATVVMAGFFDSAVIGLTTGIMTLLILIFGEIIPKSYANNHPKKFAIFSVRFLHALQWILYPAIIALEWVTNLVAGKHTDEQISEEELREIATKSAKQGTIEEGEGAMIQKLFAFNDITAEDIMTPRVHMVNIDDTQTIESATNIIKEHPFTRFPVTHGDIDNIIGYVHSRDLLLAHHREQENSSIKEILHPILAVPKQMPIDDIMKEFQKKSRHMAIVVDEYGGTDGVVTFEDVIEELVGEISDEHDISDNLIKRIDKTTVRASGDTEIRDINDFLNCTIPGEELDTIAEIILDSLQKLPRKGQKVTLGNTICTVTEVKKRRIQKVEIKKI